MKRSSLLVIFLFFGIKVFSQDFILKANSFHDFDGNYLLENGIINISMNTIDYKYSGKYDLKIFNMIPYIVIDSKYEMLLLHNEKFGIISPYLPGKKDSNVGDFGSFCITENANNSTKSFESIPYDTIKTSSYLVQGNIKYDGENLHRPSGRPWVEGVDGNGINESIDIEWKNYKGYSDRIKVLVISIGYVSFEKPYLYEFNSRPKTIMVENIENGKKKQFNLDDTPNLQILQLDDETMHVKISIIDIYKGTKWEDTCINFIKGLPQYFIDGLY